VIREIGRGSRGTRPGIVGTRSLGMGPRRRPAATEPTERHGPDAWSGVRHQNRRAADGSALQIGVGHPHRAFALWLAPDGGIGVDPGAEPWPDGAEDIAFDYGGDAVFVGADRGRVRPGAARAAAREFVTTGRRPTCLTWVEAH
jgi:hypothetical protein